MNGAVAPHTRLAESDFVYDALNRKIEEYVHVFTPTSPDPDTIALTTFNYLGLSQVREVTDPGSNVTAHEYDDFGRWIRTTDARGNAMERGYDRSGNVTLQRETAVDDTGGAQAFETVTAYNELNLPESVQSGGDVTEYWYDTSGNVVRIEDALGRDTAIDVDNVGNVRET
jgi:YD repeat-containing protein